MTVAVTHLHHVPTDEDVREGQATALVDWLGDGPPTDAAVVMGDFNARARRADLRADGRGRVPFRVCRGQRERAGDHLAVRTAGPGDGHGRPARLSRLHLGPWRDPGGRMHGSRSTDHTPTTRPSTRATTSGSPHTSRSADRASARAPRRLAPRPREHAAGPRSRARRTGLRRGRVRRACVGRRRPGARPRRDARARLRTAGPVRCADRA